MLVHRLKKGVGFDWWNLSNLTGEEIMIRFHDASVKGRRTSGWVVSRFLSPALIWLSALSTCSRHHFSSSLNHFSGSISFSSYLPACPFLLFPWPFRLLHLRLPLRPHSSFKQSSISSPPEVPSTTVPFCCLLIESLSSCNESVKSPSAQETR